MCEERRHRSPTRSSVFSDGSPNHSEDEKADTSPFGRVPNGSYLAPDSSDFRLIYQAATFVSERERGIHSATERHVPLPSDGLRSVHVQTTLYAVQYKLLTNAFTRFRRWLTALLLQFITSASPHSNWVKWGHHICFRVLITSITSSFQVFFLELNFWS